MEDSSAILVSHEMGQLREYCDAGIVLADGRLRYFDDIEAAIDHHLALVGQPR
jgi:capsular polysaccharide transport system ATP-binding protein